MRSRNLVPRFLALTLSASLVLPPHAYALRPQQQETEPQRAGLEETLRSGDPDALIQVASTRLAQWTAPAPAAVPGLPVEGSLAVPIGQVRAGLEETLRGSEPQVTQHTRRQFLQHSATTLLGVSLAPAVASQSQLLAAEDVSIQWTEALGKTPLSIEFVVNPEILDLQEDVILAERVVAKGSSARVFSMEWIPHYDRMLITLSSEKPATISLGFQLREPFFLTVAEAKSVQVTPEGVTIELPLVLPIDPSGEWRGPYKEPERGILRTKHGDKYAWIGVSSNKPVTLSVQRVAFGQPIKLKNELTKRREELEQQDREIAARARHALKVGAIVLAGGIVSTAATVAAIKAERSLKIFGAWRSVRKILSGYGPTDQATLRDALYQMTRGIARDGSVRAARYALAYGMPELEKTKATVPEVIEKLPSLKKLAIALSKNQTLVWRHVTREEFSKLIREALRLDGNGKDYVIRYVPPIPEKGHWQEPSSYHSTGNWDSNTVAEPPGGYVLGGWQYVVDSPRVPARIEIIPAEQSGLEEDRPEKLTWAAWWATLGYQGATQQALANLAPQFRDAQTSQVNHLVNQLVERGFNPIPILERDIPSLLRSVPAEKLSIVWASAEELMSKGIDPVRVFFPTVPSVTAITNPLPEDLFKIGIENWALLTENLFRNAASPINALYAAQDILTMIAPPAVEPQRFLAAMAFVGRLANVKINLLWGTRLVPAVYKASPTIEKIKGNLDHLESLVLQLAQRDIMPWADFALLGTPIVDLKRQANELLRYPGGPGGAFVAQRHLRAVWNGLVIEAIWEMADRMARERSPDEFTVGLILLSDLSKEPGVDWFQVAEPKLTQLLSDAIELIHGGFAYRIEVNQMGNGPDQTIRLIQGKRILPDGVGWDGASGLEEGTAITKETAAGLEEDRPEKLTWAAWWATLGQWDYFKQQLKWYFSTDKETTRQLWIEAYRLVNYAVERGGNAREAIRMITQTLDYGKTHLTVRRGDPNSQKVVAIVRTLGAVLAERLDLRWDDLGRLYNAIYGGMSGEDYVAKEKLFQAAQRSLFEETNSVGLLSVFNREYASDFPGASVSPDQFGQSLNGVVGLYSRAFRELIGRMADQHLGPALLDGFRYVSVLEKAISYYRDGVSYVVKYVPEKGHTVEGWATVQDYDNIVGYQVGDSNTVQQPDYPVYGTKTIRTEKYVIDIPESLTLKPTDTENRLKGGLEEKWVAGLPAVRSTQDRATALRFLVDTGKGEAGVLRLLEMAVRLRLEGNLPIQAAGVATEEELAEAEAAMPDDISRESLRTRVFTYTPGDEESHRIARALAETLVPELAGLHPELVITEMNRSTVTWFLQALQQLGVTRFTQEMFDQVESYLTAA